MNSIVRSAFVVVALVIATASASAQGMFYAEEKKDDRFYVFNIKANWDAFKASGETGTGLTRLGVGPNGETVYADNETALELFFFKHGIKEKVDRARAAGSAIEWRDGKTRFTVGSNFYMEMSNRIQLALHVRAARRLGHAPGHGGRGDSKGSFRIRRAKFKLEGWFYKPNLEYEFQLNWTDVVNTPASQLLEDANIDWDISKKKASASSSAR